MSEPVKLDPIFGTKFGDHASDCPCDTCVRFQAECRARIACLEQMRADLGDIADQAEAEAEIQHYCPDCGERCLCSSYEYDGNCDHQCPPEEGWS